MAKENYIAGLDLGTQTVRAVQAKVSETGELSVVGCGSVPANGMRKGVIVDIEEAVSSISHALEKLERMTGVPVISANISVGGSHVTCIESKGVVAVSKADGEITESDMIRVVDASQAISMPPNREVIHVIPKNFVLDGQTGIKDPLGMTGIRLEVETLIIHGGMPYLKNLNKALAQSGLHPQEFVFAPLAAATAVLNRRQKELGVVVIDLGAGTTGVCVFEENNLLHTAVIPVGGMHITNDIAIGLRCTVETAEKVKVTYGHCDPKAVGKSSVALSELDPEETETVPQAMVAEIIQARLEEIFVYVQKELKSIDRDGKLPGGIVLTGGGAHLPGVAEFAKAFLRLPTQIGHVENLETIIDEVTDPSYATACGLLISGGRPQPVSSSFSAALSGLSGNKFIAKAKDIFKSFLP